MKSTILSTSVERGPEFQHSGDVRVMVLAIQVEMQLSPLGLSFID